MYLKVMFVGIWFNHMFQSADLIVNKSWCIDLLLFGTIGSRLMIQVALIGSRIILRVSPFNSLVVEPHLIWNTSNGLTLALTLTLTLTVTVTVTLTCQCLHPVCYWLAKYTLKEDGICDNVSAFGFCCWKCCRSCLLLKCFNTYCIFLWFALLTRQRLGGHIIPDS